MKKVRYIKGVVTLNIDYEKCVGCGMCQIVCPHQVVKIIGKKAKIVDKDGCMECGACAVNCPVEAIGVDPGVGCATLIINRWLKGKNLGSGGCC